MFYHDIYDDTFKNGSDMVFFPLDAFYKLPFCDAKNGSRLLYIPDDERICTLAFASPG